MMKAADVNTYLHSLRNDGPYPNPDVDTFKAGDPQTEVHGIAVGWMSYSWALEKAVELGCNLFITHEPTYYDHLDADPTVFRLSGAVAKREFLKASGLVVLRCHDLWDLMPETGIADSWGRFLGLGKAVRTGRYLRAYALQPQTASYFAGTLARRLAPLGQPGVQLLGPGEKQLASIAIGTGAITPVLEMLLELEVDAVIATDDGIDYWRDGALAIDLDIPIFVVNHPVSELAGVSALAGHLQAAFPDVPVYHIPQKCMYVLIPPQSGS
jgi:putative NIF3 family GTP cyclohydrolase 1 type 2